MGFHTLPQVSIIIPTKNCWSLLYETVESIRKQTYTNWEAIVVDDDSTDGTVEQMLILSREDPRIRFLRRSGNRSGSPVCRNIGITVSTGKYIVFLDSDDCLAPFCLENRVKAMQDHPSLDFGVFPCQLFQIMPGDVPLLWNADTQENDIDRFLSLDVPWATTGPIWRRQALTQLGPWDESLLRWQDWEFHFRALIEGLNYKRFAGPDCFWRMPAPGRETIGSTGYTMAEHIRSNERLFSKVHCMLSKAQLIDAHRRYLLAGLYFWLANKWAKYGSKKEATRVWTFCQEKQLIGNIEYLEGLFYFKVWGNPFTGRVARGYVARRWPRKLRAEFSSTFKNTPLPLSPHDLSSSIVCV